MPRSLRSISSLSGVFIAIISVTVTTAALLPLRERVNSTTVALVHLFVIVVVATLFERRASFAASVLAAALFNYCFLPPYYTFTISGPENWISFFVFLAVAITVGHLSATANRRRIEAERLYRELDDAFEKASMAEGLRRSEKLKTSLLDAVTHDFRTPLTSIKASVTMLIEDANLGKGRRALDPHGRSELLEVINEEADRLNTFVESMVELARFKVGATELRRSSATAEEIIVKAAKRVRSVKNGRRLTSQVEPSLPDLSVDARFIVEAVYNLIQNTAKYSPPGTTIKIAASRHNDCVRFFVEDEGPGIPKSERESVFERFYRGRGDNGGSGLGMGLAIVRGIIEAHGGKIWVEAGKKGARFVFDLPAAINGH